MTWFWLNMSLAAPFYLAWTLIPLWLVFRYPDTGPDTPAQAQLAAHGVAYSTDVFHSSDQLAGARVHEIIHANSDVSVAEVVKPRPAPTPSAGGEAETSQPLVAARKVVDAALPR